jgi:hypothetical protein
MATRRSYGNDEDFTKGQWQRFVGAQQQLSTAIRALCRMPAGDSSHIESDEGDGASIVWFNQPSSHPKYGGAKNVHEWWGKLSLGRRLREQFGIELNVPIIIAPGSNQLGNRVHRDLERLGRNADTDADVAIIITDARDAPRLERNSSIPLLIISASRLIETPANLRDVFAERLRSADYFNFSKVLKSEETFYGREEFLARLQGTLLTERSNATVFGLRKAGKSSVLQMLKLRLSKRGVPSVVIDLSANLSLDADQLRAEILEKLIQGLKQTQHSISPRLVADVTNSGERVSLPAFKRLLVPLVQCSSQQGFVMLVDETDLCLEPFRDVERSHRSASTQADIVRRQQRLGVFAELRGITQEDLEDGQLQFVFSGVSIALVESSTLFGAENYLFKFAPSMTLGPMTRDEIASLVRGLSKRSGMSFAGHEDITTLHHEYGGHPFLVRRACSFIANSSARRNSRVVPYLVTSADVQDAIGSRSENSPYRDVVQVLRSFYGYHPEAAIALLDWAGDSSVSLSPDVKNLGERYGLISGGELLLEAIRSVDPAEVQVDIL